jgi:hypothetical protein
VKTTTPHLNATRVRQTALEVAKQERPFWKCRRVSAVFLQRVEAHTRAFIVAEVKRHPSKGKTLS